MDWYYIQQFRSIGRLQQFLVGKLRHHTWVL
jgi:hypothetical protein